MNIRKVMMNTDNCRTYCSLVFLSSEYRFRSTTAERRLRRVRRLTARKRIALILNLRRIFGLLLWLSALAYLINPQWMAWSSLLAAQLATLDGGWNLAGLRTIGLLDFQQPG